MTYGELYGPAMSLTSQDGADAYFEDLVEYTMTNHDKTRVEAEELVRHNLGYFAGYYDNETRERVERLFKCEHPVFGSIEENGAPTIEAAFQAGVAMAKEAYGSSTTKSI